ncbi:MAG: 5-oxoprolinase subunit PxpB [Ferruginibacter sp.]|nr:5-oxoprolinase subunit PxpB [Chitinophagaceae bacterium]
MNTLSPAYRIFPLGDSAITADFGNCIDETINREVIARFTQLQKHPLPGMIEAVPAYSSLTIYYDMVALKRRITGSLTLFEWMQQQLNERLQQPVSYTEVKERLINIPVCYEGEFAPDIQQLAAAKSITVEEVTQLHISKSYKVYMLGFLPGFAYMGKVDEKISMPRKPVPVNMVPGSVGIAGLQTGIYPMASPGGWQVIGRTPLKLFDADREEPALLAAGDRVQFYSINKDEFETISKREEDN